VIDFHCHLDLYQDYKSVRMECDRLGMYVLSVTTTPTAWKGTSAIAEGSTRIRTALGLHPQLASERKGELPLFDALLPQAKDAGEIGLDGTPELRESWKDQVMVFEHILAECAKAGGRVLSIHSRRASAEVLNCLERVPRCGVPILHWFSGSVRELKRAIALGCWFSVGPSMLAARKGRGLVLQMPRDRVLTESDGPFARIDDIPVWPWQVKAALNELSNIWAVPPDEAQAVVNQNLRGLLSTQGLM